MIRFHRALHVILVAILAASFSPVSHPASACAEEPAADPTALELFEERILPIFRSPDPSSCVQCHLAAVDLKSYILPSQEQTFASLRDQGLVDLEHPEKSKILELIRMGEKDLDAGARLLHETTRRAELDAFAAWIQACALDPALRNLPRSKPESRAGPERPDPVIRHARRSRLVDSFARKIWSQRMRCFPCHTPYELDRSNPKHNRPRQKVRELAESLEEGYAKRLRIFRKTPEATMRYLIEDSRRTPPGRLPLLNLEAPRSSLLLLKPTAKLPRLVGLDREKPSHVEPVSHLGGLKMHADDPSYKAFVSWIEDYARVVGDRYRSIEELPADNWHASKHVILLSAVPEAWPALARVQLFVHPWDAERSEWQREPVAFTQNSVTPKRRVVGALFLLRGEASARVVERWDSETPTLRPGRYLVRAFVDSRERLKEDPTTFLGDADRAGEIEIDARWGQGFRASEKIDARAMRSPGSSPGASEEP